MAYLVFILLSVVLFVGFFVLTWYEGGRGVRVLAARRTRLDERVARAEFILAHVDFRAFAQEELKRFAHYVGHEAAHLSLRIVRAAERLLTRLVRHLRAQRTVEVRPAGETREFIKTMSDFKGRLKDTMPEVPSVHEGEH